MWCEVQQPEGELPDGWADANLGLSFPLAVLALLYGLGLVVIVGFVSTKDWIDGCLRLSGLGTIKKDRLDTMRNIYLCQ